MNEPLRLEIPEDRKLHQRIDSLEQKVDRLLNMLCPTEEYLDAEQVGALLGYAERTVAEKLSKRPGFPAKVGRRWLKSAVLKWAASNA